MRAFRHTSLIAAALVLAGCVSVLPTQEAPAALYRIGTPQPVTGLTADVIIREPEAARLFGGARMLAEDADGGLRVMRQAEWVGRYTRLAQIALIESLSASGEGLALDASSGASGAYELAWSVDDISVSGGQARCVFALTVMRGRDRVPLATRRVSGAALATRADAAARAKALAEASRGCVGEAGAFVVETIRKAEAASD